MTRWLAWTGVWVGLATWVYAVLATVELAGISYDVRAPQSPDITSTPDYVSGSAPAVVVVIGLGIPLASWSLTSGRARRAADVVLSIGLVAGGGFLWSVGHPRPVAPWLVGGIGLALAITTMVPGDRSSGPDRPWAARLLLGLAGVVCAAFAAQALVERAWDLRLWTIPYWLGLATAVPMIWLAVGWPRRPYPQLWSWFFGLGLGLLGLLFTVGGVVGLREGALVSLPEESQDGWSIGGPALFLGCGLLAAAVAAGRGRWAMSAASMGGAVMVLLALLGPTLA